MKVRATQNGYYGCYREAGDVFDVPNDAKASWFEPADKPAGKPGKKKPNDDLDVDPVGEDS